jgi:hypothetical protein
MPRSQRCFPRLSGTREQANPRDTVYIDMLDDDLEPA